MATRSRATRAADQTARAKAARDAAAAEQAGDSASDTAGVDTDDLNDAAAGDFLDEVAGADADGTFYDNILNPDPDDPDAGVSADDVATERAEADTGPRDPGDFAGSDADDDDVSDAEASQDPDPETGTPETPGEPAQAVTPRSTRQGKAKGAGGAKGAKAGATPREPKAPKQPGTCLCGCGTTCQRPQAQFVRGHDSVLAKALRASYADGTMTRQQVLDHAAMVSVKFLGKLTKSVDAVDAEQAAVTAASEARARMLAASQATAAAKSGS